jgi:hypothetical protein
MYFTLNTFPHCDDGIRKRASFRLADWFVLADTLDRWLCRVFDLLGTPGCRVSVFRLFGRVPDPKANNRNPAP